MAKSTRTVYRQRTITKGGGGADDSDEARFGRRVKIEPNGCWSYDGNLTRYGTFTRKVTAFGAKDREHVGAHRFAYETLVGRIPDGHHLHHECENPGCVNPAHLRPLTPAEHCIEHSRLREAS